MDRYFNEAKTMKSFGHPPTPSAHTMLHWKIIGNPNFSNLLKRIVNRFKRAGYSLDIMRQTACLVFNPIMVEGYAALFSCTAVVQASDSMTASM